MENQSELRDTVDVLPVTAERWPDLEKLFGANGAYSNCWCMFWRLPRSDFNAMRPAERKAVLEGITRDNQVPGVLAYAAGQPAGWCSIGPRAGFAALERSRILKPVDDQPVWSIVCFFVGKGYRRQGLLPALLRGAVAYAASQGARIVEGYPIDMQSPKLNGQKLTGYAGYMGVASVFRALGFVEVAQASETQRVMRYFVP